MEAEFLIKVKVTFIKPDVWVFKELMKETEWLHFHKDVKMGQNQTRYEHNSGWWGGIVRQCVGQMVERVYGRCTAAVLTVRRSRGRLLGWFYDPRVEKNLLCMEEQGGCQWHKCWGSIMTGNGAFLTSTKGGWSGWLFLTNNYIKILNGWGFYLHSCSDHYETLR